MQVPVEEAGVRKEKKNAQRRSRSLEMKAGCSSERQDTGKKGRMQLLIRVPEAWQNTCMRGKILKRKIEYLLERKKEEAPRHLERKTRQTRKEKQSAGTGQHGSKRGAFGIWLPLVMAHVYHSD
jgi:hypothetical protein